VTICADVDLLAASAIRGRLNHRVKTPVSFKTPRRDVGHPGAMTTQDRADIAALRDAVRGRVVLPEDEGWDAARAAWNLAVDQRPAAVVQAAGPEDVQAVVDTARGAGLRVAPQSTGHGSELIPSLEGAVLLKTSAMRGTEVDAGSGVARVEAGVLAGDVAAAAGEHGLAPVLGFAPSVGVTGLTLGGGVGWLSRSYGLACNNVHALEVVTTSGERRRVDADNEPELFWALRGGGRFAIVTALEIEVHPVAEAFAGMLIWPAERAPAVLEQLRRLVADVPESFSAVFRYLAVPDIEAAPPPLRGRRVVAVAAAHLGTEADGRGLVEPLRSAGEALVDTFAPVGPADLVRVAGDPEDPVPARGDGFLVNELPDALAEQVSELIAQDALAPLGVFELRQLGGALARASDDHGALGSAQAAFSVFASGAVMGPDDPPAIDARLAELRERLAPFAAERELLTLARLGTDPARAFDDDTWARLRRARDAYDPERLVLASHDAP
jgi:FAD/FMN-containing dehydrogenase